MAPMNRREFPVLALGAVAALTACDNEQRPSSTATLLNNDAIQAAMKSLSSAIGTLEDTVGDFGSDDWKEVVPQVEDASTDVRDAFDRLRQALSIQDAS